VPEHRFSLELPGNWVTGSAFLRSSTFAAFTRRSPIFAREYRAMLQAARRNRVWFIAVDASRTALARATRLLGPSRGLFPTIFVVPGKVLGPAPLWPAHVVTPASWSGSTPDQGPGVYCNPRPAPGDACRFTFTTAAGKLGIVLRRAARRLPGRPALFVGWAEGVAVDSAGQGLEPAPAPAFDDAWSSLRYTP
jgi:hypothetical protein